MKHLLGFIEVTNACGREDLRDLTRLAYLASREGMIALWLRTVSREAVNAVLNPVVSQSGVDVAGLLFLTDAAPLEALPYARVATFRVLTSPALRQLLPDEGRSVFGTRPGIELLRGRLPGRADRGGIVPRRSPIATWRLSPSAKAG